MTKRLKLDEPTHAQRVLVAQDNVNFALQTGPRPWRCGSLVEQTRIAVAYGSGVAR